VLRAIYPDAIRPRPQAAQFPVVTEREQLGALQAAADRPESAHVRGYLMSIGDPFRTVTKASTFLRYGATGWLCMAWRKEAAMRVLLWIAAPMMLVGAAMLVAGVGAAGLWIGVIAVGIAMVAIDRSRPHKSVPR
jgi:hypothetical protein